MRIDNVGTSKYSFLPEDTRKILEEKDRELEDFLEKLKAGCETNKERENRIAAERKEAEKARAKKKRIQQLNSEIAYYRSRLMANPDDKTARGQLSMAKCLRYWASF